MSEALFERAAGGLHEARSAGTTPAEHVHENVVSVMREDGIDLSDRNPQVLTAELAQWADIVITMGCEDACPVIPGKRYLDWELPDPGGLPDAQVREIRDDIAKRVGVLLESLDRNSS
jgi:arsenate reductase